MPEDDLMLTEERQYPNAICGTQTELLEEIHQKENSIAIYQRDIQALDYELSRIIHKDITHKGSGTLEEIASGLASFFGQELPQCERLPLDILNLVRLFDDVVKGESYRLLFSTVSGNMCRKFHTDINDLRLICTYFGEGTLWVAEDESSKVKEDDSINDEYIHQANAGDVLILKGALHPEGNPVLHRSPAIEENGSRRLLLRLDTNNLLEF
ncbi:MAG: DUF1826 domain-containing protein [Cytophagales bacterium]|nr:DUF1826 domain-containing protein [Cytophagales bacterium]